MTSLFVSHAHEDADLVGALKRLIEDAFLGGVKVFASSAPESLPPGVQWQAELWKHLETSDAYIIVLSPLSIRKPWVTFEAGAAAGRRVPLIPLCVRGIAVDQVGPPINAYQGIELNSGPACAQLINRISELHGTRSKNNSRLRQRVVDLAAAPAKALPIEVPAIAETDVWQPDLASVFGLFVVYLVVRAIETGVSVDLKQACDRLQYVKYDYAYGFLVALRTARLILFRSDFTTFWSFDYVHPELQRDLPETLDRRIDALVRDEDLDEGERSVFEGELRRIDDYIDDLQSAS